LDLLYKHHCAHFHILHLRPQWSPISSVPRYDSGTPCIVPGTGRPAQYHDVDDLCPRPKAICIVLDMGACGPPGADRDTNIES